MAAQRASLPKFGEWDGEEGVPYTAYFDKARKARPGGKMINPNDPQENPDILNHVPPAQGNLRARTIPAEPTGQAVRRARESQMSREDIDYGQFPNSPVHYGRRGVSSAETNRRSSRQSAGSEYSFERSPLHPHARTPGRTNGAPSPAREGRIMYESGHATPGRSRLRSRGVESPEKGAAVPKFGEWDETDPASADGYTEVFNQVRKERQGGQTPGRQTGSSHGNPRKQSPEHGPKGCCFMWRRK